MKQIKPQTLVITGPTATGKTAVGIELAQRLGGEIVSADSMQIYRRLDIGTAKPTAAELQAAVHHMVDVAGPEEHYSVARYVQEAALCIDDILARGKLPIIVGGTGLYIDSLLSGRDFSLECPAVRERLGREYDGLGGEAMLERLRGFDPERAAKLHPADRRRIIRAIEIYELTGKTITEHDRETQALPPRYSHEKLALSFADRELLYSRIDRRVDLMLEAGLLAEVRELLDSGLSPDCTSMQAIGYKELVGHLRGGTELDAAIEDIKRESRRYAKRQLTWLRRDAAVKWVLWNSESEISAGRLPSTFFSPPRA